MSTDQDMSSPRARDSRIAGLYRLSVSERIDALTERLWLDPATAARLKSGAALLSAERADRMIENVIGVFGLPLAVAPNFLVNGRDYVVPMVVEEASVVAAVSGAAKLARASGGFSVDAGESLLVGQILVTNVADADAAMPAVRRAAGELVALANRLQPSLVERGGGARDVEVFRARLATDGATAEPACDASIVLHLLVDTRDAMGANTVNTMCEGIAPRVEELTSGTAVMKILSNLADRSVVSARVTYPVAALAEPGHSGQSVRDAIVLAGRFADADEHRAATHNKGILNGIDAVAIATGNDWRAIEAGAHAFAAKDGAYRSLTSWTVDPGGNLSGRLELPLKVGVVGGSMHANPAVAVSLQLAGTTTSAELAGLMAAVGLAQNFAALRALVTTGIQEGHMRLHARSVAASAGTPPEHFEAVVDRLVESGEIKVRKAAELLEAISAGGELKPAGSNRAMEVHGRAAGKVILLGEHAAVFGRRALALPLDAAVTACVRECTGRTTLEFIGDGQPLRQAPAGLDELASLVVGQLGLAGRHFEVRVQSAVPRACGLGSSAAVAVAVIRAFDHVFALGLSNEAVNDLAYTCEKLAHGDPSGIDNTVATYEEAVLYCKAAAQPMQKLELEAFPPIVIASSGVQSSTREQVAAVAARHAAMPAHYAAIFDEIDRLSAEGAAALVRQDYRTLGLLMNLCQGLLNAIGVSTPELERMVDIAREHGAAGAKLTGAGGGGCIVALCPGRKQQVALALRDAGYGVIGSGD
jgi:hydroxymethylglutaryl-CoA reductase